MRLNNFQSPASHHHKDVLAKYGTKTAQSVTGKHLKVVTRNGLSSSKNTLIHPEVKFALTL